MQPLEDLLNRVRWDPGFAKGTFALGYVDRVAGQEEIVPFAEVRLDAEHPGMFGVEDEYGTLRHIPLHRVRTVYRDGAVIWRRRT